MKEWEVDGGGGAHKAPIICWPGVVAAAKNGPGASQKYYPAGIYHAQEEISWHYDSSDTVKNQKHNLACQLMLALVRRKTPSYPSWCGC